MASDNEASCESDPNFAVICAFMEKFGGTCGLASIDFLELQEMLENTQEVSQELIDLHIKLLRKLRKSVSTDRWERAIIKVCHGFCVQDAWEIERFGYKKARLSSKIRVLKELLEMQFDYNARFKSEINKMSAEELRSQPLGKDKQGHAYWFQNDNNCQIRVYKEDPDEETWTLVAKDRDGLVALINELSDGDSKVSSESAINEEDSNSLVEKPIIDTGQVDSSSSDSTKKLSSESENSNESKKEDTISTPPEEEAANENSDEEKSQSPPHLTAECDPQGTKRAATSDDDEDAKKPKLEAMVGEAIEEPVMLVRGEGSGEDSKCDNPIVGEEIEEDVVYVYGCGSGHDCRTGNEDQDAKKDSAEDVNKGVETVSSEKSTNRDAGDSENYVSISCSDPDGSSREVPTSPVKSPFKLGTIIDTKTDNKFFNTSRSPTKKSRWDVETIIAKEPNCVDAEEKEEGEATTPKKMFFFGPGCLQFSPTVSFGQQVPQNSEEGFVEERGEDHSDEGPAIPSNTKGDIGYRIDNKEGESDKTIECVQSSEDKEETSLVDRKTPIESRLDGSLEDRNAEIEETKAGQPKTDHEDEEEKIRTPPQPESEESGKVAEVTEEIEKLEEEIVPEVEASCTKIPAEEMKKLPEVTATLVECEEIRPKREESKEETGKSETKESQPVPVDEDKCIKKQAYVLCEQMGALEETRNSVGARVRKSRSMNDVKEERINHEADPAAIKKVASEENIPNSKAEEAKDDKEKEEKQQAKGAANNANNKSVRGRKNNLSEDQPKIFTRRTTRSSKNEEVVPKTIEEKVTETNELSSVKEVKEETNSSEKGKVEEPAQAAPPRRGRSRGVPKVEKEESVDGEGSKKMKMSNKASPDDKDEKKSEEIVEAVTIESSNSSDLVELPDRDPLAVSGEESKIEEKPMSLSTFSLDFTESPAPPLTRSGLRKRGRESPQNTEEIEETAGKRVKKGKRNVDVKLRRSIEEQKKQELVSSDEAASDEKSPKKKGGKHKKEARGDEAVVVSSDAEGEAPKEAQKKSQANKNKRLLSSLGIDPELALGFGEDSPVGVRQSRRIAQLKIKEEAERRKLEEETGHEGGHDTHKKKKKKKSDDKDYRVEKKRWKEVDEEEAQEDDSGDSKKKKKKKKKKRRKFDEFNPWRSSSDSSSSNEEEDDEIPEESDYEVLQFVSDHEFSPESDLEGDGEALPLKRARTARKDFSRTTSSQRQRPDEGRKRLMALVKSFLL